MFVVFIDHTHLIFFTFLLCYDMDFMMSLSGDKPADIVDAFNTTSRYLDDISNINDICFYSMISLIYTLELQMTLISLIQKPVFLDLD